MSGCVLLSAAECRDLDRRAVAGGATMADLMRSAGAAVADEVERRVPPDGRVAILCGPGNNGGDGYVAGRRLREKGLRVELFGLGSPKPGTAASAMARLWGGPVRDAGQLDLRDADLVVDALFGTGLTRALDEKAVAIIERVNAAGVPILAVDMPSGVNSDTGAVGKAAIQAGRTVTFATMKPGHLLFPGRGHCGEVTIADIGVPRPLVDEIGSRLWRNGPELWRGTWPRLGTTSHKYDRGHALVLSGPEAHTGAARLAARAALRIGAGLVSVVTPSSALTVNAAQLTAIMLRVCDSVDDLRSLLADGRFNAVALGPALGVGASTVERVGAVLERDRATVLDADALTSFSGRVDTLRAFIKSDRRSPIVLTPHEGEFRRLYAGDGEANAEALELVGLPSKVERARAAARLTGGIVVLKGPDTVIAAPDGRAAINANGSAYLATAGSGDVLGGMVTGLLAQGMPGFEAACAAVWLHAEAGAGHGPGLIAEDLPELLPEVLRQLL